jgi:predicted acylesterase/phospholipase RssA
MGIPVRFKTYKSRGTPLDCKIWEAARATSAAPTFFKRIEIGRGQPYIDGGLGCNNPSRVVLHEARALFGARQVGCLVSIGTGQAKVIGIEKPRPFRPTNFVDTLEAIATDCEDTHQAMLDLFDNLQNTYFRLNVDQGMQEINLSERENWSKVEAHTTQYMEKKEVREKLDLLANEIAVPKAKISIEQLGMEESLV